MISPEETMIRTIAIIAIPVALVFSGGLALAQSPTRPEFEVATIRLNPDCTGGGGHEQLSRGKVGVECVSLRDYIRVAFGGFGRNPNAKPPEISGGPAWVYTDRYDIVAKAPGDADINEMYGPMMQSLIEQRFQLKIHNEVRERPVYFLKVASKKLTPSKDGVCVPIDMSQILKSRPPDNYCGRMTTRKGADNIIFDGYGITMADFARSIYKDATDRPVLDRTGLTGRFDIHFEFVPSTAVLSADDTGRSIFTALQDQLGLRLSPGKGPVEVLVIDHVERPSQN
jgi:uncharacterized protein (TIGR03435 family)